MIPAIRAESLLPKYSERSARKSRSVEKPIIKKVDDLFKARYKIVIQLVTGALLGFLALRWGLTSQLVPFDGRRALGAWMIVVTALAVAAGSNAFNLTDGSDGLAAGAGAVSFGALALVAVLQHHPGVGLMPAILAGCLVGFLFYNLFPARIFMGDTGSLALGTANGGQSLRRRQRQRPPHLRVSHRLADRPGNAGRLRLRRRIARAVHQSARKGSHQLRQCSLAKSRRRASPDARQPAHRSFR